MTNRIIRWFNRYDMEHTQRKMKQWNTDNFQIFFQEIFESELTIEEKKTLVEVIEWYTVSNYHFN
jgi:uncharacterized protein YbgA (DUF1722 family)